MYIWQYLTKYYIMETKPNLDYKTKTIYFNKISSKSIDFVLVVKSDCRIKGTLLWKLILQQYKKGEN